VASLNKKNEGLTISLKDVRRDLGLSQEVMAKRLSMSQPTLSRVESGERELEPAEFKRLQKMAGRFPGLIFDPVAQLDEWLTMQGKRRAGVEFPEEVHTSILKALGIDKEFLQKHGG
jgi:transcriptional regulator with XRE-family HTH domain